LNPRNSDIIEEELYTKEELQKYVLDVLRFVTDHVEIGFNTILKKWDTNFGIGYQNNDDLLRIFEASKSQLSLEHYSELINDLREQTFHMNDEQAKLLINQFVEVHPDLLKYQDLEW
jgi:hypothetical protein